MTVVCHIGGCDDLLPSLVVVGLTPPPKNGGGVQQPWPDGQRSWVVDHKQEDSPPPTNKGMGVGRQQQHCQQPPVGFGTDIL